MLVIFSVAEAHSALVREIGEGTIRNQNARSKKLIFKIISQSSRIGYTLKQKCTRSKSLGSNLCRCRDAQSIYLCNEMKCRSEQSNSSAIDLQSKSMQTRRAIFAMLLLGKDILAKEKGIYSKCAFSVKWNSAFCRKVALSTKRGKHAVLTRTLIGRRFLDFQLDALKVLFLTL